MKIFKTKVKVTPQPATVPVKEQESKVAFNPAKTPPRKNRFQARAQMDMLVTLATISNNWTVKELGYKGYKSFRLTQNTSLNPATIMLKVVNEKLVMNSVALVKTQPVPAPVQSKGMWKSKPKSTPVAAAPVMVEQRKELIASKNSELKHLENHLISFS